ncbi:MarR family winged helix-turn-helix transcriptional regulator [Micromonospora okii]|uniref:MarR family winged helix-turn-helix transcriptional regulator n=1 Tax=Micromonospora okii TaxID=1182970 RepID=UPI0021049CD9|nr:MarR family transcriptional regulator [Micromonospora okii]
MDLVVLADVPLGRLLVTAGHIVSQRWNRLLAEHGLTQAGMGTLITLARHGELPHRVVAERCFIRPATLTGIVDTLERDGLVERHRDDADRRSVRLALTPAGRARVAELTTLMQARAPMTSVDADPAKAEVIRQFLLEVIGTGEEPHVTSPDARPEGRAC